MYHVSRITYHERESGQTLMETIIAIFILTTALSSGLALMVYAFGNSSNSQNEIVASNLAREGIDMVRAMRDSNWLAADAAMSSGDLQTCNDIGLLCYPQAFSGPTYNLAAGSYRLQFGASQTWALESVVDYNLYLQANGLYSHTPAGNSIYARKILIQNDTAAPFTNQNSNWKLIVKSIVLWRGKGCPGFNAYDDLATVNTKCKIVVEEHLTNWKDYK